MTPHFIGEEPCVQFLPDGRNVRVVDHPIVFVPSIGEPITVPVGFETDGGSVPWIAEPFVGGPFESKARDGYIIHDFLYAAAPPEEDHFAAALVSTKRAHADRVLLEAARARGVDWIRAEDIYIGVREGGWYAWRGHAIQNKKDQAGA